MAYQPVSTKSNDTFECSICEVYLDKNGKLEAWTESKEMSPYGWGYSEKEAFDEMLSGLQLMLNDVQKWKPVPFESLFIGMEFEPQVADVTTS